MRAKANPPIWRGGNQVFTRMGACWALDCKRPRGKGVGATSNMGPTPTTDLPEVHPDAGHKAEFVIAVLAEGYR